MADHNQALEDLALLVQLCDRLADEQQGSMYHPDILAQRNAVVRRLRRFIEGTVTKPQPVTEAEMEEAGRRAQAQQVDAQGRFVAAGAGVTATPAPDITDEELTRRFTRSIGGPNPMYRCNGCGYEEYGARNLLVEHARTCGVTGGHSETFCAHTPMDQKNTKGGSVR